MTTFTGLVSYPSHCRRRPQGGGGHHEGQVPVLHH